MIIKLNEKTVKIQIFDTGGLEDFQEIRRTYYKGANVALLVYDITRKETFTHVTKWLEEIKSNISEQITIILIGNKKDLENKREVSFNELVSFCHKNYLDYSEVSSFMNSQVDEIFNLIAQKIIENNNFIEKGNKGISLDITSFYKTNNRKYNCNC
jgi:Ras-related protein Rab-2A